MFSVKVLSDGPLPRPEESDRIYIYIYVCVCVCTYVCVSLSVIGCKHNPLQLRVSRICQTKKEEINYPCSVFVISASLPAGWQHFFHYVTVSGIRLSVITPLDYRLHSLRQWTCTGQSETQQGDCALADVHVNYFEWTATTTTLDF